MTKTIIVCDVCGRETSVDDRVALKKRVGRRGGELNCDMCRTCFDRITRELKGATPSREALFIEAVKAAVELHSNGPVGTQTAFDIDREFHRAVYNALDAYENAKTEATK